MLAVLSLSYGVPPREWLGLTEQQFQQDFGASVYESALVLHQQVLEESKRG